MAKKTQITEDTTKYIGIGPLHLKYDPKDKETNAKVLATYMLARTRRMFRWNNLPETIPERNLEVMLQSNGVLTGTKVDGKLYVFFGSLAGKPDPYYIPTHFIVANPALNFSKQLEIGKECVILKNDSMYMGLLPLFSKYCTILAENELSINVVDILSRSALVFKADGEREKTSAEDYIKKLEDGNLSVITSDKLLGTDGVEAQVGATASASIITNLIELEQYFKASMFNELGLNANWNAKRESLSSSESLLNTDTLLPLIDDMLECRKEFCEEFNKLYGTNISVEFNSAWEINEENIELGKELTDEEVYEGTEEGEKLRLEVKDEEDEREVDEEKEEEIAEREVDRDEPLEDKGGKDNED